MYSSPATPIGTGSCQASSTYSWVFATARPIGGSPPSAVYALEVMRMLASVAPYPLKKRRPSPQRRTCSTGSTSPPVTMTFSSGSASTGVTASAEGMVLRWVIRSSRSVRSRSSPGIIASRRASTSSAPLHSAVKMSATEASKCSGA